MKRELCDDLAGVMAERDRLRDQVGMLRERIALFQVDALAARVPLPTIGEISAPPSGYLWQIRAEYTGGTSQSWPVDDEVSAQNEYLLILAEQAAGAHDNLAGLAIERRPVRPWEPVCSRRFDGTVSEGDR